MINPKEIKLFSSTAVAFSRMGTMLSIFRNFWRKLDWLWIVVSVCLLAGSVFVYSNREETFLMVKFVFDLKGLEVFAGGIATIFTLTQKIKTRKLSFKKAMSFHEFRLPVEDGLSFIGNPVTLVFAITLSKGSFLYPTEYFPKFSELEIAFIGLVSAYLLFISIMELWTNIKVTCTISSQEMTAIPADGAKGEVPKPLQ